MLPLVWCPCDGISIHALREEGDAMQGKYNSQSMLFLSTPSARRATHSQMEEQAHREISIHALREEGDVPVIAPSDRFLNFYPRPPRGGRLTYALIGSALISFLSTPSARRATRYGAVVVGIVPISIHALREEGDYPDIQKFLKRLNFYPRPPRGGRLVYALIGSALILFLSTPSARRATAGRKVKRCP